ncbi:MAG TPA: phosphatidate cytidylyltransferase, partial [Paracoccaceae bacterium]|nr:phosphatidate cytidylyltransferase [Paracoccaceae bacterium]
MAGAGGRWDDLVMRLASGAALAGIGLAAVWAGGVWFHVFVAAAVGVMVWELARMLGAGPLAIWPGGGAGLAMLVASEIPEGFALPLILAPALFRSDTMRGNRTQYALFAAAIMLAGFGFVALRDDFGFRWLAWLALVVIATDVGGYFAGRAFGGPKIWPRVSPKKTWSGTVAGWVASALVSVPFVLAESAGWELLGIAVAASMASQLGDVAESAIKRRSGVKDSSNLIPGH